MTYWQQWGRSELNEMRDVPEEEIEDAEGDHELDEEDDSCPKCGGPGCNYCLMLSW